MLDIIRSKLLDNQRVLVILRGVPGSGKSTIAHNIYDTVSNGCALSDVGVVRIYSAVICSTDDVCTMLNGGKYKFDPTRLGLYHSINQSVAHACMKQGIDCVIIDNTNIKHRDYEQYVATAQIYGYTIVKYKVGVTDFTNFPTLADDYRHRNTHGVPLNTILRMGASFEE